MDHFTKYGCGSYVRLILPLLTVGALSAPGCAYPSFGTQVPIIWGQVTHNGKPIRDGLVTFTPEEGGSDEGMVPINVDGTYRVEANYRGLPLATGWYRISVQPSRLLHARPPENEKSSTQNGAKDLNKRSVAGSNSSDDPDKSSSEESTEEFSPPQGEVSEIPFSYYDPKSSRLKLWVRPQFQRVNINLLD